MAEGVVSGQAEAHALARRFNEAGTGGLQRNITQQLTRVGQRLRPSVGRSALSVLPRAGGLAALVARTTRVDVDRQGDAGITIRIDGSLNVAALNAGRLSHPTYGHDPTVDQDVEPEFAEKPVKDSERDFGKEVEEAVRDTGREILRGF